MGKPDLSLGGPSLDDLRDAEDVTRHILGNLQIPRSRDKVERILRSYQAADVETKLPSGKWHIDVASIDETLDALVAEGYVYVIHGKKSWEDVADAARSLKSTIDHLVEDGVDRLHGWVTHMEKAGEDPTADQYAMTPLGFEALTGHKQFERPVADDEPPVDPADIKPATIGAP